MPQVKLVGAQFTRIPRLPSGFTELHRNQTVNLTAAEWAAISESQKQVLEITVPVAGDVESAPAGGIAASNVQGALNELDAEKANAGDVRAIKTIRGTTGSIAGSGTVDVQFNFATAWPDVNYTVSREIEDATGELRVLCLISKLVGSVTLRIQNTNAVTARTGTIHITAVHD